MNSNSNSQWSTMNSNSQRSTVNSNFRNFFLENKIKSNKMSLNFGKKNKIFKDEIFVVKKND